MSWAGAFMGFSAALVVVGVIVAVNVLMSRQQRGEAESDVGVFGIAAIMVVVGFTIIGAVVGV